MSAGYNWFLIIVAAVVSVLAIGVALYILIAYQHPEDKNQAWLPKIVVIFGISLAIWTVLLFPLDVANRGACNIALPLSSCHLAIPAKQLWYACYVMIAVMVFIVCPFAIFYYESDSDMNLSQKLVSSTMWTGATAVVIGLILGICYAYAGFVIFEVTGVVSGMAPLSLLDEVNGTQLDACILPGSGPFSETISGRMCDAVNGHPYLENWKLRTSIWVYIVALLATVGWVLFMVFAAVGFVALPMDFIREWVGRPRSTIPRSEYISKAKALHQRAKQIKEVADNLKRDERENGRGRKWRRHFHMLNQQLMSLEEDGIALEKVFPQGEDPDYMWAITVLMIWLKLFIGLLGIVLSLFWLLHVVLYIFLQPPPTSFLNWFFIRLDRIFPLFGTLAFSVFCFYLIGCTIKGCSKVGLNLLIFTVHPMKLGATLMSSFLFNVALVLLACTAAIQFCSQAFSLYANETAIYQIFGNQIMNLQGLQWLYKADIFLYCMFGFVALAALWFSIKGPEPWKRKNEFDAYSR